MRVTLNHKAEFKEVLKNYVPGPEALEVLSRIPLVILLGVSGSGRNTIINHLVETGKYKFIVSDTTRPPKVRNGELEQDGVQYYFRSEEEVLDDLRQGKYLEAELIHNQQVSGTSIRELVQVADSNKIPINEVDMGGTDNIISVKPDTQFFFVVPLSYDEWMRRLTGREQMSDAELDNRLTTAVRVIEKGLAEEHFTFVINDDSADSAVRIDEQINGGRNIGHHDEARAVTEQLLSDIKKHHQV